MTASALPNIDQALEFLDALWPEDNPDAYLVACTGRGPRELRPWYRCSVAEKAQLAAAATEQGKDANVWVNICGYGHRPHGRGKQSEVRYVPGVWADVDAKYVSDPVAALQSLGEWRPSLIVWSGNGAQAYWLFEGGPVDLGFYAGGSGERLHQLQGRANVLCARWIEWLCQRLGTSLDRVGDLARVLRVPGTNNCKDIDNLKPVYLVERNGRFDPAALSAEVDGLQVSVPRDWHMTAEEAAAAFARRGTVTDEQVESICRTWGPKLLQAVVNRIKDNSRDRSAWWWCRQMNDLCVPPDVAFDLGLQFLDRFPRTDSAGNEDRLDERWWRAKIDSAYSYPPREPPRNPDVAELVARYLDRTGRRLAGDEDEVQVSDPLADTALRNHFVGTFGWQMHFTPASGYMTWREGRWFSEGRENPTVRDLYERAAENYRQVLMDGVNGNEQATNEVRRESRKWMSNSRTKAIIEQTQQRVRVNFEELNAHSHLLNCRNCVVNLETGETYEPAPELLFTHQTSCDYVPWDELPVEDRDRFLRYLSSSTSDSEALTAGIQRAAGYTLTGETSEDKLFLVWGVRRSGKSTLVDGLLDVMGRGGFSGQVKPEVMMSSYKGRGNVDDAVAQVSGARMVATFEPERGERFAEGLLKTATGGEVMTARALYYSHYNFRPRWKIWVATNSLPGTMDRAVHARLVFLPFYVSFEGREDRTLRPWIRDPSGGGRVLLSWAVEGAREWYGNGPSGRSGVRPQDIPEHVAALDIYEETEDPISVFIREMCTRTTARNESILTRDAYEIYQMWALSSGEKLWSKKAFAQSVEEHQFFRSRNGAGQMIFFGLKLNDQVAQKQRELRHEM